jgi:hypothetical protein
MPSALSALARSFSSEAQLVLVFETVVAYVLGP